MQYRVDWELGWAPGQIAGRTWFQPKAAWVERRAGHCGSAL